MVVRGATCPWLLSGGHCCLHGVQTGVVSALLTSNVPLQALALMAAFKDEWPCLIIVPSSLRGDISLLSCTTESLQMGRYMLIPLSQSIPVCQLTLTSRPGCGSIP